MKNEITNGVQGLPGTAEANTQSSREDPQKARRGRVATNAMKRGKSRNCQGNVCHGIICTFFSFP